MLFESAHVVGSMLFRVDGQLVSLQVLDGFQGSGGT